MKTCAIVLTSKNQKALQNFSYFLNTNTETNLNYLKKNLKKRRKMKVITILKSPNNNKSAQEQFEIKKFSLQCNVTGTKIFKFLVLIKKMKDFVFSDINIKLKMFSDKSKQMLLNRKLFNWDNYYHRTPDNSNICVLQCFKTFKIQNRRKASAGHRFVNHYFKSSRGVLKLLEVFAK